MFAIDDNGRLMQLPRAPANKDLLEMRGWRFIRENGRWNTETREAVIDAIPDLREIGGGFDDFSNAWLQRRAVEHSNRRPITLTADPDSDRQGVDTMTVKISWTDRFLFSAFFRRSLLAIAASLTMLIIVIYFFG